MASDPVTPQPKQNHNGLQDPFTEEKNGNSRNLGGDGENNREGKSGLVADGEDSKKETPSLFYAYARRVGPCYIRLLILLTSRLAQLYSLQRCTMLYG